MFRPLVAPGGACYDEGDCLDGWCDLSAACPGTCQAYLAPGGECASGSGRCPRDYLCDYGTGTCVEWIQPADPGEGESCLYGSCATGLYCDDTRICRRPSEDGGPCHNSEVSGWIPCAEGLFCDGDIYHPRIPEGGACSGPAWDDMQANCVDGLVCSMDLICVEPVLVRTVGAACNPITTPFCDIVADLYCDVETMQCVALPGAGEPCARSMNGVPCRGGTWCTPEDTCTSPKPDGQPCGHNIECVSRNCDGGTCQANDPLACSDRF